MSRASPAKFPLTRRSVLYGIGLCATYGGMNGLPLALAAPADQARQCRPPSRLRALSPPYVARFVYPEGDELLFVAARHSLDQGSPTHALIRHVLTSMAPKRIILEGYFDDPARLLPQDLELFRRNIHPENRYALALADTLGIRAIGGDLPRDRRARASLSHGFQLEDVVGTHIVRLLAGQPSDGRLAAVKALVKRDLESIYPVDSFNFGEWYARRIGEPLSDAGVRSLYRGPCGSGIVAEIASFESETRNKHLLSIIAAGRGKEARVAAVFGANHLYAVFDQLAMGTTKMDVITPADLPQKPSQEL